MARLVFCSHCQQQVPGMSDESRICCPQCGKVLDTDYLVEETSFAKDKFGQSQVCGNFIRSSRPESSRDVSREYRLEKAEQELRCMKNTLGMGENEEIVDMAKRLYKIAVEQNFTRGRKTDQVLASCLYIACREKRKPYLLIDFSNYLSINVYVLGAVFLQLCKVLMLEQHLNCQPVDPSWFINKFTESLPGGKNKWVIQTTQRIITSMKRDWMQTGRKPSGLCGAALYISAHAHGLKCSKSDIMRIVHVCDATLTKRLVEFENTESGSLTVEEFHVKEKELEELREEPNVAVRVDEKNDVLCKHKGIGKAFAYGLCKICYDDCMQISGGLGGGSNPPAFQHAEVKRSEKASVEQNSNDPDVDTRPSQSLDNSKQSSDATNLGEELNNSKVETECGRFQFMEPESGNDPANTAVDVGAKTVGEGTEAADESDNLSDIDDAEVDIYLLNEEGKRYKKMIWEELNREYIEEQAAKAASTNCSEEAKKLEQTKRRKEKQQAREAEARNLTPSQTPEESTSRMFKKKGIQFSPERLAKIFEKDGPHTSKKRKIESDMDTGEKELDELGPENEKMGIEDEYDDEGIARTLGYNPDYPDIDEEFYGDDYDYDEY